MTPTRLRECLEILHWSQRGAADVICCSDRLVRSWAAGGEAVPAEIAAWLEALVAAHAANPVPDEWVRVRDDPPS